MAGIAAGGEIQRGPTTKNLGRRRAAGIYGAIVTAAILDTAGGHVSTTVLVISVVVTLLVYWLAEEYAEVLGEQVEGGRLPSRASIWEALAATWPMVTASYAPLLALVLAKLAGASDLTAADDDELACLIGNRVHDLSSEFSSRPSVCYLPNLSDRRSVHKGPPVCKIADVAMFQRARSEEQREARRQAILAAAAAPPGCWRAPPR